MINNIEIEKLLNFQKESKILIIGAFGIAMYIAACQIASNIGDIYFSRERFKSTNFWN